MKAQIVDGMWSISEIPAQEMGQLLAFVDSYSYIASSHVNRVAAQKLYRELCEATGVTDDRVQ